MRTAVIHTEVNGVTHAGCETCAGQTSSRYHVEGPMTAVLSWVNRHNKEVHKEVA
jgi:hypothetical protein